MKEQEKGKKEDWDSGKEMSLEKENRIKNNEGKTEIKKGCGKRENKRLRWRVIKESLVRRNLVQGFLESSVPFLTFQLKISSISPNSWIII